MQHYWSKWGIIFYKEKRSKEYVSLKILHVKFFLLINDSLSSVYLDAGYMAEVKGCEKTGLKTEIFIKTPN